MSTETLEDVFSESSEEEVKETEAEIKPEETKAETEEKGEEKSDEPPSSEKQDEPANREVIPFAAYADERNKRQQLEQQLATLKQEKEEAIDPVADPEGFRNQILNEVKATSQADKISMSRSLMVDAKEDYEEMEKIFIEMGQSDASLFEKMKNSDNPAKFAYETAKQNQLLAEIGDPDAYRERLKAEILAGLNTEEKVEETTGSETKETEKTSTPSLANKTASGSNSEDVEKASTTTIDDLF